MKNWETIVQEYGRAEKIRYVAGDSEALTDTVLGARRMFFEDAKEMGVENYIKQIEKERLHGLHSMHYAGQSPSYTHPSPDSSGFHSGA